MNTEMLIDGLLLGTESDRAKWRRNQPHLVGVSVGVCCWAQQAYLRKSQRSYTTLRTPRSDIPQFSAPWN